MLSVSNLTNTYGNQIIFDNVSFMINPGEKGGSIGRNGSCKITLFT